MSPTPEFAHDHDVRLYQGAQELFPALVEAMDAALSDIQFETYIFDFTGAGSSVGEALARAAQRVLQFDPGAATFGFVSQWPFFSDRLVHSQDSLNTFKSAASS